MFGAMNLGKSKSISVLRVIKLFTSCIIYELKRIYGMFSTTYKLRHKFVFPMSEVLLFLGGISFGTNYHL